MSWVKDVAVWDAGAVEEMASGVAMDLESGVHW